MARSVQSDAYRFLTGKLVAARKAAGLSQQQVADKIRRPQSYIAKIENGERRLDVVEFLELTQAMDVDPLEIIRSIRLPRP
jgi:transcriptional regulator with XRE-family HTH domain